MVSVRVVSGEGGECGGGWWCVVSVVSVVSVVCHQRACPPLRTPPITACQTSTYECEGVVSVVRVVVCGECGECGECGMSPKGVSPTEDTSHSSMPNLHL